MIFYLKGQDYSQTFKKARAVANALLTKKPDSTIFHLSEENWSEPLFMELLESQGLFEKKYVILASRLFSNFADFLTEMLPEMKKSEHIFLLVEELLPKSVEEKILKEADKVEEVKAPARKESGYAEFNKFSLTDALADKDKRRLWTLLQKAHMAGVADEEILPILFWQMRTQLLLKLSEKPEKLGLKPFVLGKMKRANTKWNEAELKKATGDLVAIYHDTRFGLVDFEIALERFCLTIGG